MATPNTTAPFSTLPYNQDNWWFGQSTWRMQNGTGIELQGPSIQAPIPDQSPQLTTPNYVQNQLQARQNRFNNAQEAKQKINSSWNLNPGGLNISAIGNGVATPEQINAGDIGSPTINTNPQDQTYINPTQPSPSFGAYGLSL